MPSATDNSALECLRILFSQVRREVNFDALLNNETEKNLETAESEITLLMQLSTQQKLDPVQLEDLSRAANEFTGPALIRLTGLIIAAVAVQMVIAGLRECGLFA